MILNRYEYTKILNNKLPESWKSQTALDELSEFLQMNWEQRSVFYNDEEVKSSQQFIEFTGQKGIKTKNYVGTIVFKGEQLNIYPKVFSTDIDDHDTDELSTGHLMKNLVNWIEYCNRLEYPFINISSELSDAEDLKELFITLYIAYVRSALERGLFYQYNDETSDVKSIKGKLNLSDYMTKKIPTGQYDSFQCTYSKFEFDNKINRIIRSTCKQLLGITSGKNQRILRKILSRMNEVSDVHCTPRDCDNIRLSKMHRNYEIIISMSKMFLYNKTLTYNVGANESFCFLFPTELLFEGFVGGFMKSVICEFGGKVKLQESKMSLVDKIIYKGEENEAAFTMRHDIVVEYNGKLFILDTKYKELSRFENNPDYIVNLKREANQTDLYQLFEYARKRNQDNVYLLYPMFRYENREVDFPVAISDDIKLHFIRVPFIFEEDEEKTKEELRKVIMSLFKID